MKNFHCIEYVIIEKEVLWLKISYEDENGKIVESPEMGNLAVIEEDYKIEKLQFIKGDSLLSMFAGYIEDSIFFLKFTTLLNSVQSLGLDKFD